MSSEQPFGAQGVSLLVGEVSGGCQGLSSSLFYLLIHWVNGLLGHQLVSSKSSLEEFVLVSSHF